jgi:hypothetical protein
MTDRTADFFAFARERHSIYLRRRSGVAGPWTTDEILRQYRFTNVFRELDRTTAWFREHVRQPLASRPEVLLATVVFRWFNRVTTGEAVFSQPSLGLGGEADGETAWDFLLRTGDVSSMRASILQYCGSGPYVTGAYIIKTPDGLNKLDGVLQCIEWFMEQKHIVSGESSLVPHTTSELGWRQLAEDFISMRNAQPDNRGTLHGMWEWLRKFPFLGDFMAYEIVTDLRHTALLDHAPDIMTWANPGPGATRGLGRIFSDGKDTYNQHRHKDHLIELMQQLLHKSQNDQMWPQMQDADNVPHQMGPYCETWGSAENYGSWPRWEMRDVEHTLCEFDKHQRVLNGEGRPRGTFKS